MHPACDKDNLWRKFICHQEHDGPLKWSGKSRCLPEDTGDDEMSCSERATHAYDSEMEKSKEHNRRRWMQNSTQSIILKNLYLIALNFERKNLSGFYWLKQ